MSTDATAYAPPKRANGTEKERGKPYQSFLNWVSLNHPGFWRLRLDIVFLLYVSLGGAALASPWIFSFMAGASDSNYCGYQVNQACAGYSSAGYDAATGGTEYYIWQNGFESGEISMIFWLFILTGLVGGLIWAFFVSRGTRLRGVVTKSASPRFLVLLVLLVPFVMIPYLAGYSAFFSTHGGDFSTLFTGETTIYHNGRSIPFYFPGSTYGDNEYREGMFLLGLALASLVAISLKIIMYAGVIGLVRSLVVASICGALTFTLAIILFENFGISELIALAIISIPVIIFLALFKLDILFNRRRKMSHGVALAFSLYWPGWVLLVFAIASDYWDLFDNFFVSALVVFAIGAIVEAITFRDIARINLLPQP